MGSASAAAAAEPALAAWAQQHAYALQHWLSTTLPPHLHAARRRLHSARAAATSQLRLLLPTLYAPMKRYGWMVAVALVLLVLFSPRQRRPGVGSSTAPPATRNTAATPLRGDLGGNHGGGSKSSRGLHPAPPNAEYLSLEPVEPDGLLASAGWDAVATLHHYRDLPYHPVALLGKESSASLAGSRPGPNGRPVRFSIPVKCFSSPYPRTGRFRGVQRFSGLLRRHVSFSAGPVSTSRTDSCRAAKEVLVIAAADDCPPGRLCVPAAAGSPDLDIDVVPTGLLSAFSSALNDAEADRAAIAKKAAGVGQQQQQPGRLGGSSKGGHTHPPARGASRSLLQLKEARVLQQQGQGQGQAHQRGHGSSGSSRPPPVPTPPPRAASLMMQTEMAVELLAFAPWAHALYLGNQLQQSISVPDSTPLHFYSRRHCEVADAKRRSGSSIAASGSPWPHNEGDARNLVNRLVTPDSVAALSPKAWAMPPYYAHYCGWGLLPFSGQRYVVIFNALEEAPPASSGPSSSSSSLVTPHHRSPSPTPASSPILSLRVETLLALYDALSPTHTVVYYRDVAAVPQMPRPVGSTIPPPPPAPRGGGSSSSHSSQLLRQHYHPDIEALEQHAHARIASGASPRGSLVVLPRLIGEVLRAEKEESRKGAAAAAAATTPASAHSSRPAASVVAGSGARGGGKDKSGGGAVSPLSILLSTLADASGYVAAQGAPTYLSLLWGGDRPVVMHASRGAELRWNASTWMGMLSGSRVTLSRSQAGLARLARAEVVDPLMGGGGGGGRPLGED